MMQNQLNAIIYEYNCKPAFPLRDELNCSAKQPSGLPSLEGGDVLQDPRSEQVAAATLWGSLQGPLGLGEEAAE